MSDADALATEARRQLGPPPTPPSDPPLVSIVVVSHNGVEHLRTLFAGLAERTAYPHLEVIVVDNGSGDESLGFLRTVEAPFPVSIVANPHNESFSDANNQGAALARGELLLFLNNDIEPFESGWLGELVHCLLRGDADVIGATLVFPRGGGEGGEQPCVVQHRGLRFRDEGGTLGPVLHGWDADPLDDKLGEDIETPVVVAACMLLEASLFRRVGGFTHGYVYGSEDIDICLKLRAAGHRIRCSGRALLIHRPGSTRRTAVVFEQARDRKLRNHRLLLSQWGPRLRRQHDLDALAGGGMWVQEGREAGAVATSSEEAEALSICVRASDGEDRQLDGLQRSAQARGNRCLVLCGEEVDDLRGLECDVAIHIRGSARYVSVPGQFNVLWAPQPREDLSGPECDRYDLVLVSEARQAVALRATSRTPIAVVAEEGALGTALAAARIADRPLMVDPPHDRSHPLATAPSH